MNPNAIRCFVPAAVILAVAVTAGCREKAPAQSAQAQPAPAAQPAVKKPHPFRGKVEKIDPAAKSMTVAGENVEGWMPAMTMVYTVDKPEILDKIAVGDRITATVYDGDFSTLHDVAVSSEKPSK